MRSAVVAVALLGCAVRLPRSELPAIEPTNLIDAKTYTTRVAGLRATLARSKIELDTQAMIETCAVHHGIDDCIRCDIAGRGDTGDIDPDLIDGVAIAFGQYPTSVLVAAQLEHVALCSKIRYAHDKADPAGMAIFADHRLFISIEHFVGKRHDIYVDFTIEQVVHHELFHMLDHATQGEHMNDDREWHALNPPGFTYRDAAEVEHVRPAGFVDNYATTNEAEDRASVFEYLMGQPGKLCEIAQDDPIVAAKTATVWKRVAKVMPAKLLHQHAPCVDWAERKGGKPKPKPKPPVAKPKSLFQPKY